MSSTKGNAKGKGKRRFTAAHLLVGLHFVIVFVPLSLVFVWAFVNNWPWPELFPPEFSLRGFQAVTGPSSRLGEALFNSITLALMTACIATFAATLASRALVHHEFFGKEVFHFFSTVPFLVPTTVFAMGIQILFMRLGLANSLFGVALSHSAVALPYALAVMIDITSALGKRYEEQGLVLGASKWQAIRSVTLPALVPRLLSAAAISYIESMVQYFLTLLLGGGKVISITTYMYPFLQGTDRTVAAMYAVVFLLTSTVVFLIFEAIIKKIGAERYTGFTV